MTQEIQIDDEVFAYLQKHAKAFVDEPNDVLRRLLLAEPEDRIAARSVRSNEVEADPVRARGNPRRTRKASRSSGEKARTRAPSDSLLPESEYVMPILFALERAGGRAPASEVIEAVGKSLGDRLMPMDLEKMDNGRMRWEMRTQFARLKMSKEGLLDTDAPRGVWAISDEGRLKLSKQEVVTA